MRRSTRAFVVLAALTLSACGGESAGGRFKRYSVNGVSMIENPPRIGTVATLALSDSVARDIGGLAERAEDEFNHRNGFLTGVSLSNGGLAVIDWTRVRLFDSAGVQTAVVGREGRGPGEFAGLSQICRLPGDSVLVVDGNLRRATVITPAGEIVREYPTASASTLAAGCFDDGSLVTQASQKAPSGAVLETAAVRVGADGAVVDTIGIFPSMALGGVSQYVRLHLRGKSLYVSDPRKNEVRRFRLDGTLDQVMRMGDKAREMSASDAQRWLSGPVAAMGSDAASEVARETGDVVWPFYRRVLIDGTGRVWVLDFPDSDTAPDRWTAYDSVGTFVGSLDLPRGPSRPVSNAAAGGPQTSASVAPELVDAYGDFVILLERDAEGAAHFRTRRIR